MVLFVGTHERQLDDKGRLALPASFRTHLGERCYLVVGDDQCLKVVASDEFEAIAADLKERVKRGEVTLQYQRVVAASATPVTIDKQGRINVEEKLRAYAGLATEARVVVTGNFDVVEIWSPERFELVRAAGNADLAGGLSAQANGGPS